MANLEIPFSIRPTNPVPVDATYGPWASLAAAKAGVPLGIRYDGMTVQITGDAEYHWLASDLTNSGLIIKSSAAPLIIPITLSALITLRNTNSLSIGTTYDISDADALGGNITVKATALNVIDGNGLWSAPIQRGAAIRFVLTGSAGSVNQLTFTRTSGSGPVALMSGSIPYTTSLVNTANLVAANINLSAGATGVRAIVFSTAGADRPSIVLIEKDGITGAVPALSASLTTLTSSNITNVELALTTKRVILQSFFDVDNNMITNAYDSLYNVSIKCTLARAIVLGYNPILTFNWTDIRYQNFTFINTGFRNIFLSTSFVSIQRNGYFDNCNIENLTSTGVPFNNVRQIGSIVTGNNIINFLLSGSTCKHTIIGLHANSATFTNNTGEGTITFTNSTLGSNSAHQNVSILSNTLRLPAIFSLSGIISTAAANFNGNQFNSTSSVSMSSVTVGAAGVYDISGNIFEPLATISIVNNVFTGLRINNSIFKSPTGSIPQFNYQNGSFAGVFNINNSTVGYLNLSLVGTAALFEIINSDFRHGLSYTGSFASLNISVRDSTVDKATLFNEGGFLKQIKLLRAKISSTSFSVPNINITNITLFDVSVDISISNSSFVLGEVLNIYGGSDINGLDIQGVIGTSAFYSFDITRSIIKNSILIPYVNVPSINARPILSGTDIYDSTLEFLDDTITNLASTTMLEKCLIKNSNICVGIVEGGGLAGASYMFASTIIDSTFRSIVRYYADLDNIHMIGSTFDTTGYPAESLSLRMVNSFLNKSTLAIDASASGGVTIDIDTFTQRFKVLALAPTVAMNLFYTKIDHASYTYGTGDVEIKMSSPPNSKLSYVPKGFVYKKTTINTDGLLNGTVGTVKVGITGTLGAYLSQTAAAINSAGTQEVGTIAQKLGSGSDLIFTIDNSTLGQMSVIVEGVLTVL